MNILFANANSIFDYSSGSAKSIKLILEEFVNLGHNIYAVCSSISDSQCGYNNSLSLWEKSARLNQEKNSFIARFIYNGINISLIRTRTWQRNKLNSDEEENIYREAINVIKKYKIELTIGWGNLLLEESIFKEAKNNNSKICFYLVNPSYKGRKTYILDNADIIITDSRATKLLYKEEIKSRCIVIPKAVENSTLSYNFSTFTSRKNTKCLFVNPSIEKGLESFIILSKYFIDNDIDISLICIDSRNKLKIDLEYLGYDFNKLPCNIKVLPGTVSVDDLFKDISLLLLLSIWHESGSRLILESYSRGIPVIAFNTGGNIEFMGNYNQDIFPKPHIYTDQNKRLRIKKWEPKEMVQRILFLTENIDYFDSYSNKIYNENSAYQQKIRCNEALQQLINLIKILP